MGRGPTIVGSRRGAALALVLCALLMSPLAAGGADREAFEAAVSRGKELMAEGDFEGAIKALKKAEKLAPESPGELLLDLSICFNRVGRFERSEQYARAALAAAADTTAEVNARFLLGLSLAAARPEEAEGEYRKVLELSRGAANTARFRLAEVLWAQGRKEEACEELADFLEVQPGGALATEARLAMSTIACGERRQAAADPGVWHEVRTEHFRVVANAGGTRAAEIAAASERLLAVLERLAPGHELFGGESINLFAFADGESFSSHRLPGWDAGYLVPHPHGVYAACEAPEESIRLVHRQLILHSLERRFPGLPVWFRQGVAELYSNLSVDDDGAVRLGLPIANHLFFFGMPAEESPLVRVVEASAEQAAEIDAFDAWSWALVHYLALGGSELSGKVGDYLGLIAELERPRRAFERAFSVSPTELGGRVLDHVRSKPMPYVRFAPGVIEAREGSARVLPPGEADLALAELLLHTNPTRSGEVRETARRLSEERSADALAWTTLGEAQAEAGAAEAALAALRRAVELDEGSFKAHLLLGSVLLESRAARSGAAETTFDEAAATLERAVDLRPDSFAAWERLSYAHAGAAAPPDRAVEAAARALELDPGRTDLVFNLLLVRAKRRESDEVRELLRRLEALGAGEAQVTGAREMLMRLDLQEARELMRVDRLDDAVALLAEVAARSTSEELRATARQWMESARAVQQHNLFAERYNRAVVAYAAADFPGALEILDELRGFARPGLQARLVDHLRAEVEYWRDE